MTDPDAPTPPPPAPVDDITQAGPSRRGLMQGAAIAAGVATVGTFWFEGFGIARRRRDYEPTPPGAPLRFFSAREHATCQAVMDRLLPSGGVQDPGARDVNAVGYADRLLGEKLVGASIRERIRKGLARLDRLAQQRFRARRFVHLRPRAMDGLLAHQNESREGILFLRNLLELTLEAFFGDPVHGGNLDEIGWRWANHLPGFPRPTTPHWRPEELP